MNYTPICEYPLTTQLIKTVRTSMQLSQDKSAKLLHVTRRTWINWELGYTEMPLGLWELYLAKVGLHDIDIYAPVTFTRGQGKVNEVNGAERVNEVNEVNGEEPVNEVNGAERVNEVNEVNGEEPVNEVNGAERVNEVNEVNEEEPVNEVNEEEPVNNADQEGEVA
jgi:DNA-binding XRE family transcriptional regulator